MATLIDLQKELHEIYHDLTDREKWYALRNVMRKAARKVRREAWKNLDALATEELPKGATGPKGLKKNIRASEYPRAVGFYVTVQGSKDSKTANHLNRWGKLKPAARWLETGTGRKGKGHKSGPQPPRPFLGPAWEKAKPDVEAMVEKEFDNQVRKIAKKHNGN